MLIKIFPSVNILHGLWHQNKTSIWAWLGCMLSWVVYVVCMMRYVVVSNKPTPAEACLHTPPLHHWHHALSQSSHLGLSHQKPFHLGSHFKPVLANPGRLCRKLAQFMEKRETQLFYQPCEIQKEVVSTENWKLVLTFSTKLNDSWPKVGSEAAITARTVDGNDKLNKKQSVSPTNSFYRG